MKTFLLLFVAMFAPISSFAVTLDDQSQNLEQFLEFQNDQRDRAVAHRAVRRKRAPAVVDARAESALSVKPVDSNVSVDPGSGGGGGCGGASAKWSYEPGTAKFAE